MLLKPTPPSTTVCLFSVPVMIMVIIIILLSRMKRLRDRPIKDSIALNLVKKKKE